MYKLLLSNIFLLCISFHLLTGVNKTYFEVYSLEEVTQSSVVESGSFKLINVINNIWWEATFTTSNISNQMLVFGIDKKNYCDTNFYIKNIANINPSLAPPFIA